MPRTAEERSQWRVLVHCVVRSALRERTAEDKTGQVRLWIYMYAEDRDRDCCAGFNRLNAADTHTHSCTVRYMGLFSRRANSKGPDESCTHALLTMDDQSLLSLVAVLFAQFLSAV